MAASEGKGGQIFNRVTGVKEEAVAPEVGSSCPSSHSQVMCRAKRNQETEEREGREDPEHLEPLETEGKEAQVAQAEMLKERQMPPRMCH